MTLTGVSAWPSSSNTCIKEIGNNNVCSHMANILSPFQKSSIFVYHWHLLKERIRSKNLHRSGFNALDSNLAWFLNWCLGIFFWQSMSRISPCYDYHISDLINAAIAYNLARIKEAVLHLLSLVRSFGGYKALKIAVLHIRDLSKVRIVRSNLEYFDSMHCLSSRDFSISHLQR